MKLSPWTIKLHNYTTCSSIIAILGCKIQIWFYCQQVKALVVYCFYIKDQVFNKRYNILYYDFYGPYCLIFFHITMTSLPSCPCHDFLLLRYTMLPPTVCFSWIGVPNSASPINQTIPIYSPNPSVIMFLICWPNPSWSCKYIFFWVIVSIWG